MVSTARIERPPLYRGGSASTETLPATSPSSSEPARCTSTEDCLTRPRYTPSKLDRYLFKGWGLIDLPLRATFSPAHPLARRDVPLARARVSLRPRVARAQKIISLHPHLCLSVVDPDPDSQ